MRTVFTVIWLICAITWTISFALWIRAYGRSKKYGEIIPYTYSIVEIIAVMGMFISIIARNFT